MNVSSFLFLTTYIYFFTFISDIRTTSKLLGFGTLKFSYIFLYYHFNVENTKLSIQCSITSPKPDPLFVFDASNHNTSLHHHHHHRHPTMPRAWPINSIFLFWRWVIMRWREWVTSHLSRITLLILR